MRNLRNKVCYRISNRLFEKCKKHSKFYMRGHTAFLYFSVLNLEVDIQDIQYSALSIEEVEL